VERPEVEVPLVLERAVLALGIMQHHASLSTKIYRYKRCSILSLFITSFKRIRCPRGQSAGEEETYGFTV
jgi:hypothetical protein